MATKSTAHYENNPFFIASKGFTLLANMAQGVFVLLFVLSIFGYFSNAAVPNPPKSSEEESMRMASSIANVTPGDWLLIAGASMIIILAISMILALFGGVSAYASYQLSQGKEAKLTSAFKAAFENLWGFLWLQIIITVKLVLWSLLFIIPGIIMAVRYSLANVVFFDEKKHMRGNAAIKESIRMTKGAWLTTAASNSLFNILTLGFMSAVVTTAVNSVLYRQYEEVGDKKPAAHWLSWVTFIVPIVAAVLLFMFLIAVLLFAAFVGKKGA